MPANIGQFYERIVVEQPASSSVDRYGEVLITYASSSMWAKVERNTGNLQNNHGVQFSNAHYGFTVRNYVNTSSIVENANVIYAGNTYKVVYADLVVDEKKRFVRLVAERLPR
jgi:head-tail adaptor